MENFKNIPANLDPRGYTYAELSEWLGVNRTTLIAKIWKHNQRKADKLTSEPKINPVAIETMAPHTYYFSHADAQRIKDLVDAAAEKKAAKNSPHPPQETAV